MTTYLINHLRIPNDVPNGDGLEYLEKVEATFQPYGGKWLVLGQHDEVLEGAWPGSVVLMEFPDRDAANAWYNSPAYKEILHLRTDNVISDMILVDQVAPDFTSAGFAQQVRAALADRSENGNASNNDEKAIRSAVALPKSPDAVSRGGRSRSPSW